jgi:hypothetical protein
MEYRENAEFVFSRLWPFKLEIGIGSLQVIGYGPSSYSCIFFADNKRCNIGGNTFLEF